MQRQKLHDQTRVTTKCHRETKYNKIDSDFFCNYISIKLVYQIQCFFFFFGEWMLRLLMHKDIPSTDFKNIKS